MKRQRMFRPDLYECMLERRIAPAIANLGIIVQTTSGLVLSTPFPGAVNFSSLGGSISSGTAPSVSGTAFPPGIYLTGTRGISTFLPGNFTGNPNLAGSTGTTAAVQTTVAVGSGADVASTPTTSPVTRNTVGTGTLNPVLVVIGLPISGSDSTVLPLGQSFRATQPAPPAPPGPPAPPAPPPGIQSPGLPTAPTGLTSPLPNPLNHQDSSLGAPNRMPSIGTGPTTPAGGNTSAQVIPSPNGMPPSSNMVR
jgi:hypothetical protein